MTDMPLISFLRTEQLNADLHAFLLKSGFSEKDVAFVADHEKIHVTEGRRKDRSELWTEEIIDQVQRTERLLFRILEHHGVTYESADPINTNPLG